ncbi:hypothetical protein OKA04_15660 [Luteolibacter flavescens]|uniref:DUF4190 domain-containing protein n=1 Tax=Luteolibacter flavescens TaxID=1859460 RepID=A0ABT3FSJ4_9BACT|nr:hypothetical protein [Luteolibacter flavescens]MCW1886174.1 hypothetical protein [Luteolibacter flavescens]
MKRTPMTPMAQASLALPPLMAVTGILGMMIAMRGMIVGALLIAVLPLPLLLTLPILIRGVMGRYGMRAPVRGLFIATASLSTAVITIAGNEATLPLLSDPVRPLPRVAGGERATRLEFRFPEVTRVVHDPHGKIRFYRGEAPQMEPLPDGSAMLVFRGEYTSLDTWRDHATVEADAFDLGGWMGARIDIDRISVTDEGGFESGSE